MAVSGFDLFGGGGVKSVQSGLETWDGSDTSINITISEVSFDNSIVIVIPVVPPSQAQAFLTMGKLISGTTIELSRGGTLSVERTLVWQVIEFENVKSIQRGDYNYSTGVNNIPISAVDLSKSFVVTPLSHKTTSTGTSIAESVLAARLSSPTNLEVITHGSGGTLHWQVVEFN